VSPAPRADAGPPAGAEPRSPGVPEDTKGALPAESDVDALLARASPAFIVVLDRDGTTRLMNDAMLRALGYSARRVIGKNFLELFVPAAERDQVRRTFEQLGTSGQPGLHENTVLARDGRRLVVEWRGRLAEQDDGATFLYIIGVDVTERRAAERRIAEQEQQYRAVFEATTDGVIITDPETSAIVEVNPAFCRMFGYSRAELLGRRATSLVHPRSRAAVAAYRREVAAKGQSHASAVALRKDGSPIHLDLLGRTFTFRGQAAQLCVSRDATEQVRALELLEQRVDERTRELRSVLQIARDVASTLDVGRLLDVILDQLKTVVDYTGASVYRLDGEWLVSGGRRSANAAYANATELRYRASAWGPYWATLARGEPILVGDVTGDTPLARQFRHIVGRALLRSPFGFVRSCLWVPMLVRERLVGLLSIVSDQPDHYGRREAELAFAIASQAAVAIDNATLYAEAQLLADHAERRSEELAAVLELSRDLGSTLRLGPLLSLILDRLQRLVPYTGAGILVVEGDRLRQWQHRGPLSEAEAFGISYAIADWHEVWPVLASGQPILIGNVLDDSREATVYRALVDTPAHERLRYIRTCLWVPLVVRDRLTGVLAVTSGEEHAFTPHQAELAAAVASHAAVAIENARLYEQARGRAALEERQRLARELHDSVSQALYGIALGTQTAQGMLADEGNTSAAVDPLAYVMDLAEAAMAEMRALIFELRPESLQQEGLVSALQKQIDFVRARHRLDVSAKLSAEPPLPLGAKEALYRIAQEALNNTVKHAAAKHVTVSLAQENGSVVLHVADDGVGFDPGGSFPGHLGLVSMHERAQALGGSFEITSAPGRGTRTTVSVPVAG
jgi:PAS domain S-box-containing protein